MALTLVTINGPLRIPDNVNPQRGKLIFTPGSGLLVDSTDGVTLAGSVPVTIASDGTFTVALPATDNTGTQPEPNSWNWTVRFELYDTVLEPFSFALPASLGSVKFADLVRVLPAPGTYLVVPGPQGVPGGAGDGALLAANNLSDLADAAQSRSHLGLGSAATQPSTAFDTSGAAGTAQTNAATYTDGKITTEVQRANNAYDVLGAAGAALVTAKAYADTGDAATLVTAKAYTDAHSGGGGTKGILTEQKYIKAEILTMVTSASYQVVTTSGGTGSVPIAWHIAADATNRVLASTGFLRSPAGMNLDIALMLADGVTPAIYGATGDGTVGAEGNPSFYPQGLNFPQTNNEIQFTVGAEHISGGLVTIALVSQGTADGTQRIYAGSGYFFRWLLKNLDKFQP